MLLHRPTTTWRDWYNPLKGLTVSRIVSMEDAADRGQHADLQWLWHHMERTDVTVQAASSGGCRKSIKTCTICVPLKTGLMAPFHPDSRFSST